ncbi:hypothetical protein [Rhodoblastus sp.]|uniref:hypothetical protein n=1 Tax=Rhodoblastus sp. TaxID=1962975 RepID=UPI003F9D0C57
MKALTTSTGANHMTDFVAIGDVGFPLNDWNRPTLPKSQGWANMSPSNPNRPRRGPEFSQLRFSDGF